MPFDGSGNFSRLYSWQSDRDNGIRILASKMDGEFDNFSAGMNVVFFRNGLVPMSGNLNMGQNYLTGLGAGSLNALSARFSDDPNTGFFLDGYGRMALVGAGAKGVIVGNGGTSIPQRLDGLSGRFTGDNNAGNGAQGPALELAYTAQGQAVITGYNRTTTAFTPLVAAGSYFAIATNGAERARFADTGLNATGRLDAAPNNDTLGLRIAQGNTGSGFMQFGNVAATQNNFHVGTSNDGTLRWFSGNYGQGVERFRIDNVGGVYAAGALYSAGNPVWHSGNFNPALYAPLANPAFTGGMSLDGTSKFFSAPYPTSYLQLNDGLQGVLLNTAGGIIMQSVGVSIKSPLTVTGTTSLQALTAGATSLQALTATTGQYSGTLNAAGAITQNGQQVWHAGNFTPGNYAPIANPVFQGKAVINSQADSLGLVIGQNGTGGGAIQLGRFSGGSAPANFHIVAGGDGTLRFYSNTYGAGTERFRIQNDGATYAGTIYSSGYPVWHSGNFNPAKYAPLSGALFTGDVLRAADFGLSYYGGNTVLPSVVFDTANDLLTFNRNINEYGFVVNNNVIMTVNPSGANVAGTLNSAGALTQAGQQVYHTGNFNPGAYAPLSGATFSGAVQSPRYTNTGPLGTNQANACNHFQQYNPSTQTLSSGWIAAAFGDASSPRIVIGQGDSVAHLGAHNGDLTAWADLYINRGGGTVRMGATYRDGGGMMAYQATAGLSAVMTRGTAAPSGGSDGDMYFQYT